MRFSGLLTLSFFFCGTAAAADDGLSWFVETKRAAKYARIAITGSADLVRLDQEEIAAKRQLAAASALPAASRTVCGSAAQAVVDFIAAGKAGNMISGPASFERQLARWDTLGDECLRTLQAGFRTR